MDSTSLSPVRPILRLRKDPIVDSVCEARFAAASPSLSVVLPGILAAEFKSEVHSIVQTGAASFPEPIAQLDSSIAFTPKHRLFGTNGWVINVADRAVSVGFTGSYPGWEKFHPIIERVFKTVFASGMAPAVERFSAKYVNFFENASNSAASISEVLRVAVALGDQQVGSEPLLLRVETKSDEIISVVQVLHPANLQQSGATARRGLVLDIDTVLNGPFPDLESTFMSRIEEVRNEEKRVFFSLLTPAMLEKCEPEYE